MSLRPGGDASDSCAGHPSPQGNRLTGEVSSARDGYDLPLLTSFSRARQPALCGTTDVPWKVLDQRYDRTRRDRT